MRSVIAALLVTVFLGIGELAAQPVDDVTKPIEDNSFLIEEAYNQEASVVQHIFNVIRDHEQNGISFNFAQEWPLSGQEHQLSYEIPIEHSSGKTRLGEIAINYRYQALGIENHDIALAPRFSFIIATGQADGDMVKRGLAIAVGLPLSLKVGPLAFHTNAELAVDPKVDFSNGYAAPLTTVTLGQSVVWLVHPKFNILVEGLWSESSYDSQNGVTHSTHFSMINPGVRWSHDFDNGLQIVPGVSVPISSEGDVQVLLYLSFEHNF